MRADPRQKGDDSGPLTYLCDIGALDMPYSPGYIPLARNPEIISAVNKIANLTGGVSTHLMQSAQDKGDTQTRNGSLRKINVESNRCMVYSTFTQTIVRAPSLEGDGDVVVFPKTRGGLLGDLLPIPPSQTTFLQGGYGCKTMIYGEAYKSWDLIHIAMNPNLEAPRKGEGYRRSLKQAAETFLQASIAKKDFIKSKRKPSIIVKADADTGELGDKKGRSRLL